MDGRGKVHVTGKFDSNASGQSPVTCTRGSMLAPVAPSNCSTNPANCLWNALFSFDYPCKLGMFAVITLVEKTGSDVGIIAML